MTRTRKLAQIKGKISSPGAQLMFILINFNFSSANDVAKVKSFSRSAELKVSKNK